MHRTKPARLEAYPCRVCLHNCTEEEASICCDGCQSWMHADCIRYVEQHAFGLFGRQCVIPMSGLCMLLYNWTVGLVVILITYTTIRTRSSFANLLTVPYFSLSFGSRAFRFAAPSVWNKLPSDLRDTVSLTAFLHKLKTHFSSQLFLPHRVAPSASDSFITMALYKFTYLLTLLIIL